MSVRWAKIAVVAAIALLFSLFGLNNLTDYDTNFQYVAHIMSMDTIAVESPLRWRAIVNPTLHHLAYIGLITAEWAIALCCWLGAGRLLRDRQTAATFQQAKGTALFGLTAGVLLWLIGFLAIGGEWFVMWQSETWNAQQPAFRFLLMVGLGWLALMMPETPDAAGLPLTRAAPESQSENRFPEADRADASASRGVDSPQFDS